MGHSCVYVSRLWKELEKEKEKKQEAHRAVLDGIDRGVPAYDPWATLLDRWAMLIRAGCEEAGIQQLKDFLFTS